MTLIYVRRIRGHLDLSARSDSVSIVPRPRREIESGVIYHVLNRGNGRRDLFGKPADFDAFIKLLGEALQRFEVDLLAASHAIDPKALARDFRSPEQRSLVDGNGYELVATRLDGQQARIESLLHRIPERLAPPGGIERCP